MKTLQIALMTAGALMLLKQIKRKKKMEQREAWRRKRLLRRFTVKDLLYMAKKQRSLEDPLYFETYTGMTKINFQKLLNFVAPLMKNLSLGVGEEKVTIHTSMLITLRYLTAANSFNELSQEYLVSEETVSNLIPKTLKCIFAGLRKTYLAVTNTPEQWAQISDQFESCWKFPMCMGALGAKHIAITPDPEESSLFLNYKGYHSIILLAIVDADSKFIAIEVGMEGRADAEDVLGSTDIGDAIEFNNGFNFPEDEELPGTEKKVPYVFVSNDAFDLGNRILVPYKNNEGDSIVFNRRLDEVCSVVDTAFAILTNIFPIFHETSCLKPDQVKAVTLAGCVLHNFLLTENRSKSLLKRHGDKELLGIDKCPDEWSEGDGVDTRNSFSDYFHVIEELAWSSDA